MVVALSQNWLKKSSQRIYTNGGGVERGCAKRLEAYATNLNAKCIQDKRDRGTSLPIFKKTLITLYFIDFRN